MKLSIITINLNNREGLTYTINSVICQTFRDMEWIVIDGGSTDGSKELIEKHSNHFAYWVSEPDKGIYNAMNKGIKIAKGDYILFLNSGDCLSNPNILTTVFSEKIVADIEYGDIVCKRDGDSYSIIYPDRLRMSQLIESSIAHQASFIKASLFKNELYDESLKLVSDYKFFLRRALEGCSYHHINLVITIFDLNGISNTNVKLTEEEKDEVKKREIPDLILADCDDLSSQENDWQLKSFMAYHNKRKCYHSLFTFIIRSIKHIDNFFFSKTIK